jgi:glutamate synthase domain-containing protein 3
VRAPKNARFDPSAATLVGNVALYGATRGELFVAGGAGERFAVRNSGAVAVVEGVGDHGCEYMTGGIVVVLGRTGRNFAAGMSGGVAYVLDDDGGLAARTNLGLVELEPIAATADVALLRQLVRRHARLTGSVRARRLLQDWDAVVGRFTRVMPIEYSRVIEQREREQRLMRSNGDGRSEGLPDHSPRGSEAPAGGRASGDFAGVLRAGVG